MKSLLVIRRDNIGDLVCTTPLITALRDACPQAWMGVLANSYSAPVLMGNTAIDDVYEYSKLKHLSDGSSALAALRDRLALLCKLRARRLDLVLVASGAQDSRASRMAKFLSPRRIIHSAASAPGQHEVERTFTAARLLGIEGPIPPVLVNARNGALERVRKEFHRVGVRSHGRLIGLHISARRPLQRWPGERFAQLAIALHEVYDAATILFWSPGPEGHPKHPGDDRKARAIVDYVGGKAPMIAWPTTELPGLIDGLAACDGVICSDGGAMHVAAGLNKPIVCFFGDSSVERWHPWGVPHWVLKAQSGKVEDLSLQEVIDASACLFEGQLLPA